MLTLIESWNAIFKKHNSCFWRLTWGFFVFALFSETKLNSFGINETASNKKHYFKTTLPWRVVYTKIEITVLQEKGENKSNFIHFLIRVNVNPLSARNSSKLKVTFSRRESRLPVPYHFPVWSTCGFAFEHSAPRCFWPEYIPGKGLRVSLKRRRLNPYQIVFVEKRVIKYETRKQRCLRIDWNTYNRCEHLEQWTHHSNGRNRMRLSRRYLSRRNSYTFESYKDE